MADPRGGRGQATKVKKQLQADARMTAKIAMSVAKHDGICSVAGWNTDYPCRSTT